MFTAKVQRTQRFNHFLFSGERPEYKKNQLYKVNLIARATIFVTYVKLKLFSEKVRFYFLPSFLSAGIFGGSTAKNKQKHLCVLRGGELLGSIFSTYKFVLPLFPYLTSEPCLPCVLSCRSFCEAGSLKGEAGNHACPASCPVEAFAKSEA